MDGQVNLARLLGVKPSTVAQWALPNYHPKSRPVPVRLCRAIAAKTSVLVWQLRPDDWFDIWPDFIGREGAPVVPADAFFGVAANDPHAQEAA